MAKEMPFSDIFKSWLNATGFSRDEAAKLLGVERHEVDGWCVGRNNPYEKSTRLAMSWLYLFPKENSWPSFSKIAREKGYDPVELLQRLMIDSGFKLQGDVPSAADFIDSIFPPQHTE